MSNAMLAYTHSPVQTIIASAIETIRDYKWTDVVVVIQKEMLSLSKTECCSNKKVAATGSANLTNGSHIKYQMWRGEKTNKNIFNPNYSYSFYFIDQVQRHIFMFILLNHTFIAQLIWILNGNYSFGLIGFFPFQEKTVEPAITSVLVMLT